jgi:hypothetical protein
MEVVSVPWAALVAIGLAVTAVVGALWAKLSQVEKSKEEWIKRWAREAGRSDEPPEWEEKTDIRSRRDEIQKKKDERRGKDRNRQEIDERLDAYITGERTPPKFRNTR